MPEQQQASQRATQRERLALVEQTMAKLRSLVTQQQEATNASPARGCG